MSHAHLAINNEELGNNDRVSICNRDADIEHLATVAAAIPPTSGNLSRDLRRFAYPDLHADDSGDKEQLPEPPCCPTVDLEKPIPADNVTDEFGLALKKLREKLNPNNTKEAVLPCFQLPTPGVSRYVEELEKLEMEAYEKASSSEFKPFKE